MDRTPSLGRARMVVGLLLAATGLALVALLVWRAGMFAPHHRSQVSPARPHSSSTPGPGRNPAGSTGVPTEGTRRPPVTAARGGKTWFAPAAQDESALPAVTGPVPERIAVDEQYPPLRRGDVTRAVMLMGVVGDTSTVQRLLVMDESWQVFEVDIARLGGVAGGPTLSRDALSPDGTRMAVGRTGGYAIVDLRDLSQEAVGLGDSGTGYLSWAHGTVVTGRRKDARAEPSSDRTASLVTLRPGGVRTQRNAPPAIVVEGADRAALVLDGPRPTGCCAVAGWSRPGHVLFESRDGPELHLLDWDTASGSTALVSTIEPVVSNDWYLLTSYADLSG